MTVTVLDLDIVVGRYLDLGFDLGLALDLGLLSCYTPIHPSMFSSDTVRQLHARDGHVVHEAVPLHGGRGPALDLQTCSGGWYRA